MSDLQIQATALALLIERQRRKQQQLDAIDAMVGDARCRLLEAMQATDSTTVIGGDFRFECRNVVVFEVGGPMPTYEANGFLPLSHLALAIRRLTDAEREAQATAASDRYDESIYASDYEHARI